MSGDGYAGCLTADGRPVVTRPAEDGGGLLPLAPSPALRRHSPTGFAWGYGGSGPAQLALALLLDRTGDPRLSKALYQRLKAAMVAAWPWEPGARWLLPVAVLDRWIVATASGDPALARTLFGRPP